mgnify:FL=1|tara:strand:- start:621 stop:848 length:228 start_codon:yes stop_codon:yes gene_type:complete
MDTNELIGMMSNDETSSSEVHDAIKTLLYQKGAEVVDRITPSVAAGVFGSGEESEADFESPVDAVEPEQEPQDEE